MISRNTPATPYCAVNPGSLARPWLSTAKPKDTLSQFPNQENNASTRRLAICGIKADIGKENAGFFLTVQHPDLRADYVLANPPFNDSVRFRKDDDVRWQFGVPPNGNANLAWVQHFIHHLAPQGMGGFVLANGSMSSNQSGEGDIRKTIIEADVVDCMIARPGHLSFMLFSNN